ncbi:unnamed protein product [Anisakis simplex]|uniref:Ion_trans domain-containing protein n=1 Tax=Anisakis simplex TaxID=6269 RepID=A0A0M3KDI9_ANISI|nr:unnamed protein product [Anisakis simplex]
MLLSIRLKVQSGEMGTTQQNVEGVREMNDDSGVATQSVSEEVHQKRTFAGVVKTAMAVRNWVLSVQPEEGANDDRNSELNASIVFDPPAVAAQTAARLESRNSRTSLLPNQPPDGSKQQPEQQQHQPQRERCSFSKRLKKSIKLDQSLCSLFSILSITSCKAPILRSENRIFFWLDVLCLFPLDFLLFIRRDLSLVRSNRLLKSYRLKQVIERTQMRTNWPNGFKVFVLITTCVVMFHWNACAYYLISVMAGTDDEDTSVWQFTYTKIANLVLPTCEILLSEDADEDCWFNETGKDVDNRMDYVTEMMDYWHDKITVIPFSNFTKEYALSMYWSSLTLTTCGQQPYPLQSIENALEIVDTLIGLLIFAVIIGSVGNVVSTMNRDQSEFQDILDSIKFYMNYR